MASAIRSVLSFLFLGGFLWHGREVTGISLSLSTTEARGRFGLRLKDAGCNPDRACTVAETCVQLADFLQVGNVDKKKVRKGNDALCMYIHVH